VCAEYLEPAQQASCCGPPSRFSTAQFIERSGDIELLMECMKKLREEEEDVTREELARRFEKEKEEASLGIMPNQASSSNTDTSNLSRYVIDPNFSYQDFAKRDGAAEVPTFKAMVSAHNLAGVILA